MNLAELNRLENGFCRPKESFAGRKVPLEVRQFMKNFSKKYLPQIPQVIGNN